MKAKNNLRLIPEQSRPNGFTLVEILVAVTIFGIISTFIYSVLTSTLETSRAAEQKMDINHAGRYFISRITHDLSSATLLPLSGMGGFVGRHIMREGKSRDELHFTAFTRLYYTATPRIDQAEIGYYFQLPPGEPERFLRRESDAIEGAVSLGGRAMEVTAIVEEMKILYLGTAGWVDNWDTGIIRALPKAVSVELTLNDGSQSRLFSGIIRLPA